MEDIKNDLNVIAKAGSGGFMSPEKIVEELEIKNGMTIADFGCGAGYFTIPLARKVKNSGKIFAVDVLSSALESVAGRAKLEGLLNIGTIRANVEIVGGSKLQNSSIDLVMLANILFQCTDHDSVIQESKRVLKEDGKIVIIDWIPQKVFLGPKFEHSISEEYVKKLCIKNGLKFIKNVNAGAYHYGMIFTAF